MIRHIWKLVKIVLISGVVLLLVLLVAGLAIRAYRQHEIAKKLEIHTPQGITEAMYVKVGEIDQWIQIRGEDRSNPVILCLHGGPGGSWLAYTEVLQPWEKEFTVVQWDQRGTGKTLESTGTSIAGTMSVERMSQDGIEVAEFLRKHLNKEKIVLLGFSWGSLLGVTMVRERPDLFSAYVGTGQVSNMPKAQEMSYAYVLEKARAAGDTRAIRTLEQTGPPPFDNMEKIGGFFRTLDNYECASDRNAVGGALTAPNYSLHDISYLFRGFTQVPTMKVYRELLSANLTGTAKDFKVPVLFIQGAEDERTQAELTREYFGQLAAPRKEMVVIEGAGHFAVLSHAERFLQEMGSRVGPAARWQ